MKKTLLSFALFLAITFFNRESFAQVIPASRTSDWSVSGHQGSIPDPLNVIDVTSFGATGNGVTDDYASIHSAIQSLSGNQGVVYFPPGNYLIGSAIYLPDSVILRGAGSDQSHLIFQMNGAVANCISASGSVLSLYTSVISGADKGSMMIRVSDPSAFQAGTFAELVEDNGTWDTQPVSWADESVGQILHVTNVTGDSVYFDRALRFDYTSALNVRIRAFNPATEVGIECLHLYRADSVHTGVCMNIYFAYAANCWIRGVESSKSIGSHIEADQSTDISIRGCYIHDAYEYDGASTHGYGITLFKHTGQCLVENNIIRHLRHCFSLQCGANGNVIGYNYTREPHRSEVPDTAGACISMHGHYPFLNLFEGNIVRNLQIDQTWGPSGPFNTFFRNRIDLFGLIMSSGTVQSDSQNFVGNEIPNTNLFMGNYSLAGTGHLQSANNVRGTITPAGTLPLNDTSYYLTSAASYWTGFSGWPSIGDPNAMGSGTIPAKARWDSGINFTVCQDPPPTGIAVVEKDPASVQVFPNPVDRILTITKNSEMEIQSIRIINAVGQEIKSSSNHKKSETITVDVSQLNPGVYFVEIKSSNKLIVKRFIKE